MWNEERPSNREAEIVPFQGGLGSRISCWQDFTIRKPVVRVEGVVTQKFKHRSVKLGGSGLGHDFDQCARILAIGCVVFRGRDAELGNGVDVRVNHVSRTARALVGIIGAVDLPTVVLNRRPVE